MKKNILFRFAVRRTDTFRSRAAQIARLQQAYDALRAGSATDESVLPPLMLDAANAFAPALIEHFGAISLMLLDLIGSLNETGSQVALLAWAQVRLFHFDCF